MGYHGGQGPYSEREEVCASLGFKCECRICRLDREDVSMAKCDRLISENREKLLKKKPVVNFLALSSFVPIDLEIFTLIFTLTRAQVFENQTQMKTCQVRFVFVLIKQNFVFDNQS